MGRALHQPVGFAGLGQGEGAIDHRLDLPGIEQHTSEQTRLHRELEILWSQNGPSQDSALASDSKPFEPAWVAELGPAQLRVLQLGRVQAALLVRAQRRLRMLSHLLAGPGAGYAPPSSNSTAAWQPAGRAASGGQEKPGREKLRQENSSQKNAQEHDPCRV